MGNKNSERYRTRRVVKEQWRVKLEDIQAQAMRIHEEYVGSSDSSNRVALKLHALIEVLQITIDMVNEVLEDV